MTKIAEILKISARQLMTENEFKKQFYCEPIHADIACQAAKEYEAAAQARDEYMYEQLDGPSGEKINGRRLITKSLPIVSMSFYAQKYKVTIEEMKQHWRCVEEYINKKK